MNQTLNALSTDPTVQSAIVAFFTSLLAHLGIHLGKKVPKLNIAAAAKALVSTPVASAPAPAALVSLPQAAAPSAAPASNSAT